MTRALYHDRDVKLAKRPSFPFYPDRWLRDSDLLRCGDALQGVWIRVLCVLHDRTEYGIARWPIVELARAAKTTPANLRRLVEKNVLRGVDGQGELSPPVEHTFSTRHRTFPGETVTVLPAQAGPVYFCSAMVRDHFIRWEKAYRSQKPGVAMGGIATPSPSPSSSPSNSSIERGPVTARSGAIRQRQEVVLLRSAIEEKVPGFGDALDGWIAVLPPRRRWTPWAQVLRLRLFQRLSRSHSAERILEMVALATERGWQGFRLEWFVNAQGEGRKGGGPLRRRGAAPDEYSGGLIDLEGSE